MRELETTVDRLRKLYAEEVDSVREENKQLKQILAAHGIQYESALVPSVPYTSTGSNFGGSGSSISGRGATASTGYTSPSAHGAGMTMPVQSNQPAGMSPSFSQQQSPAPHVLQPRNNIHGLDYEDIGLDFVGTYERTPYLSPPP
jgi:hypothetical protein